MGIESIIKMETEISADLPLDYVKFQILPQDRYEACISGNEEEEVVGNGPLGQLLDCLPDIKAQIAQGTCESFKLELPVTIDHSWFTKATLTRFLQMASSSDLLKKSIAINNEMSQLEETRKFHLSLYAKAEEGIKSSDNSKNELLRAMDSRIAALTEELAATLGLAAGATLSPEEMLDLQKFCQHFGDVVVSNMLSKLSETSKKSLMGAPEDKKSLVPLISKDDYMKKTSGNMLILGPSDSIKAVKYNASPAKAAEMERQSSSDSEDSGFSSEDDQPTVERSRNLARSTTPRRSASPMRRIQIGRSGSRRTPALTIKSLTHFPARERISSYREASDDKLEEFEGPSKKTEFNATRMSVQDAISLFESKQKDQTVDNRKKDNSTNTNKVVFRRWSAGTGDTQDFLAKHLEEHIASEEDNARVVDEDDLKSDVGKMEENCASENLESEMTLKVEMESEAKGEITSNENDDEVAVLQTEETSEKLDSAEWSRKKEEELNQMLKKFAEFNKINLKSTKTDNRRKSSSVLDRKGGLYYSNSKEKRDEKIDRENAVKKVVKPTEIKAKQKIESKPKAEKSPLKVTDVEKKNILTKNRNVTKIMPVVSNPKKESPKPVMSKKGPTKSSPLPATRKSWPSTPSPRAVGTSPAKIPTGTPPSRITASYHKPQSPASLSKPAPQSERSRTDVKKPQVDSKRTLKKADDSKSQVLPKSGKTEKIKHVMAPKEDLACSPVKTIMQKKVTKKSSVVPLEAKPEERKILRSRPTGKPTSRKMKISTQPEETACEHEERIGDSQENVEAMTSDTNSLIGRDIVSEVQNDNLKMEAERLSSDTEKEVSSESPAQPDEVPETVSESPGEIQTEEPLPISPTAWVESNEQESSIHNGKSSDRPPPDNHDAEASSGARVRHSLSQMLLEETSEPDAIEWGNAENPPSMVYRKDAPKGLKRLLKFARKNREPNSSLWSSPYTSEGEDDGDEYKSLGKRNSDNLLKVALRPKNYGEGFLSDSEPLSARSNISNSSARSSKGSRSFFSLSAFRGNKS